MLSWKRSNNVIIAAIFLMNLAGCITATPPIDDYALARAAVESARAIESARYSPGIWSQAEEAFRKAKILFEDRDYDEARIQFIRARLAAEKAENTARVMRQKNGEVL